MPSLHFGTSVMAARVLSDVGRGPGCSVGPMRSRWGSASCTWASTTSWTWRPDWRWLRRCAAPSRACDRWCWPWRAGFRRSSRGGADGPERAPRASRPRTTRSWSTRASSRTRRRISGYRACWPTVGGWRRSRSSSWRDRRDLLPGAQDPRPRRRAEADRRRELGVGRGGGGFQRGGVRRLRRAVPRGARRHADDEVHRRLDRRPRIRSPWPGWPPRGSSRRPARVGSCSPTGRCARRACRAGGRRAGWSPSSCSRTRST